jgi:hypothetical protein
LCPAGRLNDPNSDPSSRSPGAVGLVARVSTGALSLAPLPDPDDVDSAASLEPLLAGGADNLAGLIESELGSGLGFSPAAAELDPAVELVLAGAIGPPSSSSSSSSIDALAGNEWLSDLPDSRGADRGPLDSVEPSREGHSRLNLVPASSSARGDLPRSDWESRDRSEPLDFRCPDSRRGRGIASSRVDRGSPASGFSRRVTSSNRMG